MLRKMIQLGLIHVAVAMTLVPINSTLNRVMIKELALSATLVAVLASLPYLFSPIQMAIGSFSDRHPVLGLRRTPYIVLGLLLCVLGVIISPQVAFLMAENLIMGILIGAVAFGAWGMGYNLSAVSYLSLATELSGEKERGKTIAVMWFMMITGIILTAITLSQMVEPFTPAAMERAFWIVGLVALILGLVGIIKLEKRSLPEQIEGEERYSWQLMLKTIRENRQVTLFFVYLVILLAAILGQDILLEPYAGEAFGMTVGQTARITSLWGVCVLAALLIAGVLETRVKKKVVALWGGWSSLAGFVLIASSGMIANLIIFYIGVVLLGIGTGLATVSNLSLMLDMTVAGKVGLFIGAWGMANAASRLIGSVLGGAVRDVMTRLLDDPVSSYSVVFVIEAAMLLGSLVLIRYIDVGQFRQQMKIEPSLIERAAIASDT
jgi:BCD family chlorophyll transporter-like MFS transporter